MAVPVAGAAAWYGVLRPAMVMSHGHAVRSAATVAGFALIAVTGVAMIAATAWASGTVLRRVPAEQPPQLRRAALIALAAGMAATTVLALVWGLRVHADDPADFHGNHGILATPFVPSWIVALVLMAAATALAVNAGRRQLAITRP